MLLTLIMVLLLGSWISSRSSALRCSQIGARAQRSLSTAAGPNGFEGYQQPDTKHDAYEQALQSGSKFPVIILVNPYLDQNVGSVARTMMNFGLTELRVVQPKCDIMSDHCKALSAGAFKIVENAKVFDSLKESIADLSQVVATSNRPRHMTQMVYTPHKAAEISMERCFKGDKVGIMFGRERYGLFNEELAMADCMVAIPTFSHFSSLNLAQAVNILTYELWNRNEILQRSGPPPEWLQPKDNDRLARRDELEQYFNRLERFLTERNFTYDDARRPSIYRSIRNIFQRVSFLRIPIDGHLLMPRFVLGVAFEN